jgi:hypothetical protein
MSIIVTRAGKGSPLTNNEVDSNFVNLNDTKLESLTSVNGSLLITGTGSTRNLSVIGGGGSAVSYYLNGGTNQGSFSGNTYYEMSRTAVLGPDANFSTGTDGYIAQFITDAADPSLLAIPAGNWNFELWFQASSTGGTPSFYVELYKYDGTTFTLVASSSANPENIDGGTATDLYYTALAVPTTVLTTTDRLAIRVYVVTSGRTITLHTQADNLCEIQTTFSTGLTGLNGLTAQVQSFATGTSGSDFNISSATATHTFNLPSASPSVRGALTSTDWTTFNSKVSSVSGTAPVASSGGKTPVISLDSGYGDIQNPYGSKTANFVLAAPNGSAGVPTFRAVVAADIPTLNQNTTGTASNVTGTVAIANGGTGATSAQSGMNALAGAVTSGSYLRGDGTNVVMATIQAGDVPTLNQNTTGSAATFTSTSQNSQFNSVGVGTAASGTAGEIRATNNVTAYYSDERLKTKTGSIENALDKVCQIETLLYHANETAVALGYDASVQEVGVTAQSVQKVQPEIVVPAPIDDKYLTVRYERLVPLLIEAVKELSAEVKELKEKVGK